MCAQLRFKSVCATTRSGQCFKFPPEEMLGPWLPRERPSRTLIRLRGCAGLSESVIGHTRQIVSFAEHLINSKAATILLID